MVIAQGGRGGLGNAALASSKRKAPGFALLGEPGDDLTITLELKVVADIGLVGFPSAWKSSLIAALSRARPKIADYPFTTLSPNLGVAELSDSRTFVFADLPGIIEGASEGKGRTRVAAAALTGEQAEGRAEAFAGVFGGRAVGGSAAPHPRRLRDAQTEQRLPSVAASVFGLRRNSGMRAPRAVGETASRSTSMAPRSSCARRSAVAGIPRSAAPPAARWRQPKQALCE